MNAATLAYDRTLLASARTVAERLVVRNGQLEVDVPYIVLDNFERNMNDQLYYQVITPEGKSIAGYNDLPLPPANTPRSVLYSALVHFITLIIMVNQYVSPHSISRLMSLVSWGWRWCWWRKRCHPGMV